MDKRLQTLQEKYFLPEKLKKKFKGKVRCPNCQGSGSLDNYPKSECFVCDDYGWVEKND